MKKTSQRSKTYFEAQGYTVASVEKWNSFVGNDVIDKEISCPECETIIKTWKKSGIRQDLWKFADLIAFHPDSFSVVLIQASTGGTHAEHLKKILTNERAEAWVQSVYRKICLVSWSERAPRDKKTGKVIKNKDGSKKAFVWKARVEEITYEDYC